LGPLSIHRTSWLLSPNQVLCVCTSCLEMSWLMPGCWNCDVIKWVSQTQFQELGRDWIGVSKFGDVGELRSWRSVPDSEQSMFETAGGRPVQVSASVLARAHALLGEESGGDMWRGAVWRKFIFL
jgi:hypothetical protein